MQLRDGRLAFSPSDLSAPPRVPAPDHAAARRRARGVRQAVPGQPARRPDPPQGRRARGRLPRLARRRRRPRSTRPGTRLGRGRRRHRGRRCATGRRRRSTRPPSSTAAGAGSPTSSSGSRTAATRSSTRSSRGTRGRRTCSSSASTPSRSRASRGACRRAMHVVNGLGERETFRPDDFLAYYRRVRAALPRRRSTAARPPTRTRSSTAGSATSSPAASERWEHDDHLTLVAGISRLQVERLTAGGITTLEALGDDARHEPRHEDLAADRSRSSATRPSSSSTAAATGEHRVELLPLEPDRGFALLPEPCPGDIWLDLEGHPWFEPARGLEYLFGWVELDEAGEPQLPLPLGARSRREERRRSSSSSTRSSSAAAASRACTSTTTRRTSAPRSAA